MVKKIFLIFLLLLISHLFPHADVIVYHGTSFFVNGFYVMFENGIFSNIILYNDRILVEYGGKNITFKPEGANISISINEKEIVIRAYASRGTISKIYVWGFRPNRVLLNNSGVKRVLSIDYLAPNSYYMNQTTIVLCGEHHSVLVWRLLVLPTYAGGGGGVLAITPTTTQLVETTAPSKLNIALNKQAVIGIIVLLVLVGSLYLVASSSKRW